MVTKRDYYEVLGIQQGASDQEIARAYRKLAIRFHPDSNPGDEGATAQFKEAAEAYEVLADPQKRAAYDRHGHAAFSQGAGGAGFHDAEDIFEAFGDIFGGAFGDLFGGGRRRGRRVRRGRDLQCEVTLTLEEAASGCKKTVEFNRHEICKKCDGSGARPGAQPEQCQRCGGVGQVVQSAGILRVQTTCPSCQGRGEVISDPCSKCEGRGVAARRVRLDVAIPAGADEGMQVRLNGEGEPSPDGGPSGDCYCLIRMQPHSLFQRDGTHLLIEVPITYTQAVLGTELDVPTLAGAESLSIPAGTAAGEVFRLRGKGLPDPRGRSIGDLIVQVSVEIPHKISKQQEELLRQLAELEHTNVSPKRKSFLESLASYFSANE